jgi:rRNA maturation endonuclease Nob1
MRFKSFYLTESKNTYSCKNCKYSWTDKLKVCPKCGSKKMLADSYSDTNSTMGINKNSFDNNEIDRKSVV